jgi:hypothetical protein
MRALRNSRVTAAAGLASDTALAAALAEVCWFSGLACLSWEDVCFRSILIVVQQRNPLSPYGQESFRMI